MELDEILQMYGGIGLKLVSR